MHVHKFSEFFKRTQMATPYILAQVGCWVGRLCPFSTALPNWLSTTL